MRHLTVEGMDLAIWDDLAVEISGTSVVRVALVSDSVEELLGDEAYIEVMTAVTASVRRRALIPRGFWILGAGRVDDPHWQNGLDPAVAETHHERPDTDQQYQELLSYEGILARLISRLLPLGSHDWVIIGYV